MNPALAQLFRQYYPLIRAKCSRILGDSEEAADVAQETFLRLWQDGPRDQAPSVRLAWVYRTGTRLAIDIWRRRRAGFEVLASEAVPAAERTGTGLEEVVAARRCLRALASRLSTDELTVAILSRIDGLTHPEIAEVTGRSERTVRRVLARIDVQLSRIGAEVRP